MTSPVDPSVTAALAARERFNGAFRTSDPRRLTQLLADDLVVNASINRVVDRDASSAASAEATFIKLTVQPPPVSSSPERATVSWS